MNVNIEFITSFGAAYRLTELSRQIADNPSELFDPQDEETDEVDIEFDQVREDWEEEVQYSVTSGNARFDREKGWIVDEEDVNVLLSRGFELSEAHNIVANGRGARPVSDEDVARCMRMERLAEEAKWTHAERDANERFSDI